MEVIVSSTRTQEDIQAFQKWQTKRPQTKASPTNNHKPKQWLFIHNAS